MSSIFSMPMQMCW